MMAGPRPGRQVGSQQRSGSWGTLSATAENCLRKAHDRRSAAGCGRATGCSNTLESAGWRVDCRAQVRGSGAQGAQGAERGGWDLRTGQGVGSSQFDLRRPKRALSLATQARHTMFRQFKHPSSMLTEPTWSTQAELIGHESRYLSARNCLQRRVTLSRTPPSKRRTTVWFRLCHFRNGQCCQQTPRHEHRGQRERQAMRDYLESIRQLTAQYLAIGRSTIVGAPTSHCPSTPCAVPLTKLPMYGSILRYCLSQLVRHAQTLSSMGLVRESRRPLDRPSQSQS